MTKNRQRVGHSYTPKLLFVYESQKKKGATVEVPLNRRDLY